MAQTELNLSDATTKLLWDENLLRESMKLGGPISTMGKPNVPGLIMTGKQLKAGEGGSYTIARTRDTTSSALTDRALLRGRLEALVHDSQVIPMRELTNGLQLAGGLSEYFGINGNDLLKIHERELIELINRNLNTDFFTQMQTSPTRYVSMQSGVVTFGTSTPIASITTGDFLCPEVFHKLRPKLLDGYGGTRAKIEPIMMEGGEPIFMVYTSYAQAAALKRNAEYTQALEQALVRSQGNPYFTGAVAMIDGFVIKPTHYITEATSTHGTAVTFAKGLVCGKNAAALRFGSVENGARIGTYVAEDDFKSWKAPWYSTIIGCDKLTFNSEDAATVSLWTATL